MRAGIRTLVLISVVVFVACNKGETAAPAATETTVAPAPASAPAATETTASAPPPPTPSAPSANALATADGEQAGTRLEVTELKRTSGGTISLKMTFVNDSNEPLDFGYTFGAPDSSTIDYGTIGGVYLMDPVGKKKYFVVRDTENKCVCSQGLKSVPPKGRLNLWAKFPAPPEDVQKIGIVVPKFSPMDDAPISQ